MANNVNGFETAENPSETRTPTSTSGVPASQWNRNSIARDSSGTATQSGKLLRGELPEPAGR